MCIDFLRGEWNRCIASFRVDRRFFHILIFELLIIALIVSSLFIWNVRVQGAGEQIAETRVPGYTLAGIENMYGAQLTDDVLAQVFTKIVGTAVLLLIAMLFWWTLIKNNIYNAISGIKFSKQVYWRFLLLSVVWGVVVVWVFMTLQYFMYIVFAKTFDVSSLSRIAVFITLCVLFLVLFWFTINIFTHLVRKGTFRAAVKGLYTTGIKGFKNFLLPLLFTIIVIMLLNVIMFLFMMLGNLILFMVLASIITVLFFAWVRLYYTDTIGLAELKMQKNTQKKMMKPKTRSKAQSQIKSKIHSKENKKRGKKK